MRALAGSWDNFLRIDDDGNEILVKVLNPDNPPQQPVKDVQSPRPNREELLQMLDGMRENIERLPPHALAGPINHYDFSSLLLLLSALFKAP